MFLYQTTKTYSLLTKRLNKRENTTHDEKRSTLPKICIHRHSTTLTGKQRSIGDGLSYKLKLTLRKTISSNRTTAFICYKFGVCSQSRSREIESYRPSSKFTRQRTRGIRKMQKCIMVNSLSTYIVWINVDAYVRLIRRVDWLTRITLIL